MDKIQDCISGSVVVRDRIMRLTISAFVRFAGELDENKKMSHE